MVDGDFLFGWQGVRGGRGKQPSGAERSGAEWSGVRGSSSGDGYRKRGAHLCSLLMVILAGSKSAFLRRSWSLASARNYIMLDSTRRSNSALPATYSVIIDIMIGTTAMSMCCAGESQYLVQRSMVCRALLLVMSLFHSNVDMKKKCQRQCTYIIHSKVAMKQVIANRTKLMLFVAMLL